MLNIITQVNYFDKSGTSEAIVKYSKSITLISLVIQLQRSEN